MTTELPPGAGDFFAALAEALGPVDADTLAALDAWHAEQDAWSAERPDPDSSPATTEPSDACMGGPLPATQAELAASPAQPQPDQPFFVSSSSP